MITTESKSDFYSLTNSKASRFKIQISFKHKYRFYCNYFNVKRQLSAVNQLFNLFYQISYLTRANFPVDRSDESRE